MSSLQKVCLRSDLARPEVALVIRQSSYIGTSMIPMVLLGIASVASAFGEQPFSGTWKMDASKLRVPQVPSRAELAGGVYKCLTCNPAIIVKADGTDQQVAGYPFDAMSVRALDVNRVEIVQKARGRILEKLLFTASESTQTVFMTTYPPDGGKPFSATVIDRRLGAPIPGMHLVSGTWLMEQPDNLSDAASTINIQQTADSLRLTAGSGEHFAAKFDSKDYPQEGSSEADAVALKWIDGDTIEETDKLKGKIVSVNRLKVSTDRKSLQVTVQLPDGRTQVLIFQRQTGGADY